ncbi:MAG: aminotransferase class V-fold PLP-dependent enzyme [Chloroflexota bacterium]
MTPVKKPPHLLHHDPLGIRKHFPAIQESIYLASASITPSPLPVTQAGIDFVSAKGKLPYDLDDLLAKCDELRGQYAQLIQAKTAEIGLIYTTSEAENLIVRSLNLQPGDNIVTDDLHYSASYVIYEQLAARGVEIRIARRVDNSVTPAMFAKLCDSKTRLVSVAWVSHQTGFRHDLTALADIAHAHGAYIFADVIQGVGMLPLDVRATNLDFCAAGSYKWLLGSFGVALFYVRESLLERISLDRFGSFHVLARHGELAHELPKDGRKFMYATPAFGPVYQLSAGIRFVQQVGVDKIAQHVIGLAHHLRTGFDKLGYQLLTPPNNQSGIVAFIHGHDPNHVKRQLQAANIHVNFRESDSQIRIGSALFNNTTEIDAFLDVMRTL